MADPIVVSASLTGMDTPLTFETGKLAFQSQGSVLARLGKTEVLVTANAAHHIREGIDFFPLTVDVRGAYVRRRAHPRQLLPP